VLTLDLKKNAYVLEPVYEALDFVPTNADNEPWPPCPVGWKFSDWLLVNSSKVPITISWLSWLPLHPNFPDGITPSVNEPQGSEHIKLSFDKLMLTPGESAKLSVCTSPTAPDGAEIGFGFKLEDVLYVIFSNAQFSSLGMTRKRTIGGRGGWSGTGEMFDFDPGTARRRLKDEAFYDTPSVVQHARGCVAVTAQNSAGRSQNNWNLIVRYFLGF
jgi:hypothetical protein